MARSMPPNAVTPSASDDSSFSAVEVPLLSARAEPGGESSHDTAIQLYPSGSRDDEAQSEQSGNSQRTEESTEHSDGISRTEVTLSERGERGDRRAGRSSSPRAALASYTDRLNIARVRAEFESSLLVVLTVNVLYMYYVDHKLIILFIRASQVVRLLYYPYASEQAQRGTALLVLVSNVVVLFIHAAMMATGEEYGRMLFINFIGPEPKSALKIVFLDVLIILVQSILMQCRLEAGDRLFLTKAPVPTTRSPAAGSRERDRDRERERDDSQRSPDGDTGIAEALVEIRESPS